jgi:hypothetical protein
MGTMFTSYKRTTLSGVERIHITNNTFRRNDYEMEEIPPKYTDICSIHNDDNNIRENGLPHYGS